MQCVWEHCPKAAQHFSRHYTFRRRELPGLLGYRNVSKCLNQLLKFERTGAISSHLMQNLCAVLNDPEFTRLAQADRQELLDEQVGIRAESSLLCKYATLLLGSLDRITESTDLFHCVPHEAGISMAYISGSGPLSLGILALAWRGRIGSGVCSTCQSETFLLSAGGSILSGSHSINGICPHCNQNRSWMVSSFGKIAFSLRELRSQHWSDEKDRLTLKECLRILCQEHPDLAPSNLSDLRLHDDDLTPIARPNTPGGIKLHGKRFSIV